jgi:heme exporter protein CcmD
MPDFGAYAFYIIAAYAIAGASLATLLFVTLYDLRALSRHLGDIEK